MAAPSFKNSGFDATSNGMFSPRFASSSLITCLIFFEVPTGTVLFVTSKAYFFIQRPNVRATSKTYCKSALPSSSGGVPTALNTISTSSITLSRDVVKCNLPAAELRATNSSNPGSYMGIIPAIRLSIFCLSISTHVTSTPISAKQAPDTSPTYPDPTMAIFINYRFYKLQK